MSDPALYNAILEENKCLQTAIQAVGLAAALESLNTCPFDTTLWSILPLIDNPTGCLCVYDSSSGYLRCGQCCLWTVPGGTTSVQFQIWGAGAGTANGICCAGTPFGQTGAYATVIIDAVPGCQYTLCAGCAYCCYAYCHAANFTQGCQSYVNGYGLTGVCAQGGTSYISCRMSVLHSNGYTQCRWRGEGSVATSGPCLCCNGSWYCFDNSCATCGIIPFSADPERTYRGTATGSTVYGLPSVAGGGCLDTNNYGYHTHPPVISPCHTVQPNSCCCQSFTSGSCCGGCRCQACTGVLAYPGAGGFGTHMMGNAMEWSGDTGRGGMVRVTWY